MRKHPIKKLSLLVAFGGGYVLGARAGRGRYEQIADGARRFAGNPKVQAAAGKAQETVAQQAPVVASAVKDKVSETFGHDDHADARPSSAAGQPLS
jgi:hypothetical protein